MDTGSFLIQLLLIGIGNGCLYALIALGFTVIFNATEIINMAQGEFVALGGFIAYSAIMMHLPLWLAILIPLVVGGLLGLVIEKGLFEPTRKPSPLNLLLITVGLTLVIPTASQLIWGTYPLSYDAFVPGSMKIASAVISWQSVIVIVVTFLAMAGLHFFFQKTRIGQAMLATSINKEAASMMGINVKLMIAISFALGTLFGSLGGVISTPIVNVYYFIGLGLTLKGFAASVLGGIGSIAGALLGGLILGVAESLVGGYISFAYRDLIAMLIIIGILMFRPGGILGSRALINEM
jgi:branched-chain amino acid transport system permease protein